MEYNKDWKIEIKLDGISYKDLRKIYYRILPSELTWWQRLFCNKWQPFFHGYESVHGVGQFFDRHRYCKQIKPLQTYGDVDKYLREQATLIKTNREEAVMRGLIWDDQDSECYDEIKAFVD